MFVHCIGNHCDRVEEDSVVNTQGDSDVLLFHIYAS